MWNSWVTKTVLEGQYIEFISQTSIIVTQNGIIIIK